MTEGENMDRETQYGQKYTNMDRQSKNEQTVINKDRQTKIWINRQKYEKKDIHMNRQI